MCRIDWRRTVRVVSEYAAFGLPRKADLTRRQLFVAAGGMTVAPFLRTSPASADGDVGDARRLATLAALVAAAATGPAGGVNDDLVAADVERVRRFRSEADPFFPAYADAALDDINATGFGVLAPIEALAQIRGWGEDGQHAARAAAALDLTHLCFDEDEAKQAGYSVSRLDEQIRLANSAGLKTNLMPYRYSTWVNGTQAIVQPFSAEHFLHEPADHVALSTSRDWRTHPRRDAPRPAWPPGGSRVRRGL